MAFKSFLLETIAFGALGGTSAALFFDFRVTATIIGAVSGAILSGVLAILSDGRAS